MLNIATSNSGPAASHEANRKKMLSFGAFLKSLGVAVHSAAFVLRMGVGFSSLRGLAHCTTLAKRIVWIFLD